MGNETSNYREPRRESLQTGASGARFANQHSTTASVPPGAYSVPGSQRRQAQFYVTVPAGIRPGQEFPVIANGQQLMVRCPPGIRPGMSPATCGRGRDLFRGTYCSFRAKVFPRYPGLHGDCSLHRSIFALEPDVLIVGSTWS